MKVITKIICSPWWNQNYQGPCSYDWKNKVAENKEWTVESFRKRLLRCIYIQEASDHQVQPLQRPKDSSRHPLKEQGQVYATGSIMNALLADELGKQRQRKERCIYCEGDHWRHECSCYPNMEARRNKLKNWRLIYLKEKHKTRHCKVAKKPCVHCGENMRSPESMPKEVSNEEHSRRSGKKG